ncbi:MAG: ABC transporter permease [Deltaproteobacteria bacterium]|nr:ABC transporter permease [Deltaproteobacteria bacterium]
MALVGAAVTTLIGTLIGMTAGYFQGGVDQVLCRLIDILMALPVFPIIILLAAYFSPAVHWLGMLMGVLGWGPCARIIRSQSLSLTEWSFVQGARAMGASNGYILTRYLFPFVLPLSVAKLVLAVQGYLLMGVGLGFAGLGDSSDLEWGQMLHQAYNSGALAIGCWWLLLAPITAVVVASLSMALMVYGFEKRFDPLRNRNDRRLVVE